MPACTEFSVSSRMLLQVALPGQPFSSDEMLAAQISGEGNLG